MLRINVKRAYEELGENDGLRILVDRVWPRGRSKNDLRLDAWLKEVAPSGTTTLLRSRNTWRRTRSSEATVSRHFKDIQNEVIERALR